MIAPVVGFPFGIAIVTLMVGLAVWFGQRRGMLARARLSPEATLGGRRRAAAAIGVGLAAVILGPGNLRDAPSRSWIAWIAVALVVLLPVGLVGWLGDRWFRRKDPASHLRIVSGKLPSKQSGIRAPYIIYGVSVGAMLLILLNLALNYLGT